MNYTDWTKEQLIEKIKQLENDVNIKNSLSITKKKKAYNFEKCTYRHVLLRILYLGWNYDGFVVQIDTNNTIESYLFEALQKTCLISDRPSANYHRCGRTDKGVSSFGQVISITLRSCLGLNAIEQNEIVDEIDYCHVLNRVLPPDIRVIAWHPISQGFSARFDCTKRTYKYFFPKSSLNISNMLIGCKYLEGTHDFRNFCKFDKNNVKTFIRNIMNVDIIRNPYESNQNDEWNIYVLTIDGSGFLWHQIRYIVGLLLLIGQNLEKPELIKDLLDINKYPNKPNYNMASEIPLNLYSCDYNLEKIKWITNDINLKKIIDNLQTELLFHSIKSTMLKYQIVDLQENMENPLENLEINKSLIQGVQTRIYTPIAERTTNETPEIRSRKKQKII